MYVTVDAVQPLELCAAPPLAPHFPLPEALRSDACRTMPYAVGQRSRRRRDAPPCRGTKKR